MFTPVSLSLTSADVSLRHLVLIVVVLFLVLVTPSVCDTADDVSLQKGPLAGAPPQSGEVGEIRVRLGYDVKARNRELTDHVIEYSDRLRRIAIELEARKNPSEIIDTIIEIAELTEDIADSQKEQDIPSTLRKSLNMRQQNVKDLMKKARKKLMAPLSKRFDLLLKDLKAIAASGIGEVYRRKVQVLTKELKSIKHDLQHLKSSEGLSLVKLKLEKFLEEMYTLKTAAEDGKLADQALKEGKRLSSGVSYYIVRYSIWLVPKIEMPKFLDYHSIEIQ